MTRIVSDLVVAVQELTKQREREFEQLRFLLGLATKQDLKETENRIMSAISDFSDRVNAKFEEIGTAVDGVVADVAFLKAKIEELQNTPGPITPADQALLDSIEARVGTLSTKVKDLDAATAQPPVEPLVA